MEYNQYLELVMNRFDSNYNIRLDEFDITVTYEEISKLNWLLTIQKTYNFVSYSDEIDLETIKRYSSLAFTYAKENYRGFPRELRSIIVSNSVLVSRKISAEAIRYVQGEVRNHFNAVEMPMIYDLKNKCFYGLEAYPLWGSRFKKFRKNYVHSHYDI